MLLTALPTPPAYNARQWPSAAPEPRFYRGVQFGFEVIQELIQPLSRTHLKILDTPIRVFELTLVTPAIDPNYPIYFEAPGTTYLYVVSIWVDRVEIMVCDLDIGETLSVSFPETPEQLASALQGMVADCSR